LTVEQSHFGRKADFLYGGRGFTMASEGWTGRRFVLRADGGEIACGVATGLIRPRYAIALELREYEMRRVGMLRSHFELHSMGQICGTVERRGWLRTVIDVH